MFVNYLTIPNRLARLGLGYAYGGIKRLVHVVGSSFAKEIFYTARQFTADEAIAMGLINRIFSTTDLRRECMGHVLRPVI
jgi:enoyl-CoA hydratase